MIALVRLISAGLILIRQDALLPREFQDHYPGAIGALAKVLRVFSGPRAKQGRAGERLARCLEHMGPAGIKLGQLLSTRADIFGEVFATDLGRLRDQLPPFAKEIALKEIEASLGQPWTEVFSEIGDVVGAASLAQAHRARLHDGRQVAVKVLRPHMEKRIRDDIAVLHLASGLMARLFPDARRLEPRAFATTVARSLELELDLRLEAAGAAELGLIMAKSDYMRAPEVIWDGVGKRVLTLEWATGMPLSDPKSLEQPGLNRKVLAENVIRAFLSQALDHGVFHADLHEGNLFCAAPHQLMAVDYGIVGRLGTFERRYLAEILWGFISRDYMRVAEVHFEAGYVPAHHPVESFAQALRAVGEPVFGRKADQVSMGRLLAQLFEITALFDMKLRPELVLLQKTMVTVEGVARRIDPENDLWKAAEPVVRAWITRELSPIAGAKRMLRGINRLLERLSAEPDAPGRSPGQVLARALNPENGEEAGLFDLFGSNGGRTQTPDQNAQNLARTAMGMALSAALLAGIAIGVVLAALH